MQFTEKKALVEPKLYRIDSLPQDCTRSSLQKYLKKFCRVLFLSMNKKTSNSDELEACTKVRIKSAYLESFETMPHIFRGNFLKISKTEEMIETNQNLASLYKCPIAFISSWPKKVTDIQIKEALQVKGPVKYVKRNITDNGRKKKYGIVEFESVETCIYWINQGSITVGEVKLNISKLDKNRIGQTTFTSSVPMKKLDGSAEEKKTGRKKSQKNDDKDQVIIKFKRSNPRNKTKKKLAISSVLFEKRKIDLIKSRHFDTNLRFRMI